MVDYSLEKSLQSVTSFHHSFTLFSSVGGGFSAHDAHHLQDLIRIVQLLGLKSFKTSDLHAVVQVGEGGTYRVFRCDYQRVNAVAVKQLKLPPERSESDDFRRHICSVKKDLEVMHHRPLANHPNIARLLGYGWNLFNDGASPFLVTEFAQDGNLRQYLQAKTSNVSFVSCMRLTGQIATGLHALHLCGVAHGDLKLENVLIVRNPKEKCNSEDPIAKLSDFGQSCLLSSEQTRGSAQSYCGTRGYIAPELFGGGKEPVDFIKCDIWALALLLWETLIGGRRYFDDEKIMSRLQERVPASSDSSHSEANSTQPENESSHRLGYDIFTISDCLSHIACETVDIHFKQNEFEARRVDKVSQRMVKSIFRLSLQVSPSKRCGDVSRLPFTYSMHKPWNVTEMTKQPLVKMGKNNIWNFEMFRPQNASALPYTTKIQIFSDLSTATWNSFALSTHGDPMLCLAMAYATGYGVKPDHSEFCKHTRKSAENGSVVASLILTCLEDVDKSENILKAFNDVNMNGSQKEAHETCNSVRQTSNFLDPASWSSTDNCNPLHYISLLEVSNPHASPPVAIKRQEFGSLSKVESQHRIKSLRLAVGKLKSALLNSCTSTMHYIHPHFPLCLEGTPLSFAVHFGCHESVEALLLEGAHPLDPVLKLVNKDRTAWKLQPKLALTSGLHTAVACHRPRMFDQLWFSLISSASASDLESNLRSDLRSSCASNIDELYDLLIERNWIGASVISAMAQQSLLERMLLHGSKRQAAQTDMIHALLRAFGQAAGLMSLELRGELHRIIEPVILGVQTILALGDLDIAIEIMTTLSRDGLCSYHNIPIHKQIEHRRNIVDEAIRIACSGSFDLAQSIKYFHFAREVGSGTNVDARAIKVMMDWKADKFFCICLDEGLDLHSIDEQGKNSLHHAIESGFYENFPITELLTRQIDVNAIDRAGKTPLHLAVSLGQPGIVQHLLTANAAPMAIDNQGYSILHCAVMSGKLGIVKDIINALESSEKSHGPKADLNHGNESGRAPLDGRSTLHLGVISRNLDCVKLLLDKGVDVNGVDAQGKVALHYAIQLNDYAQAVCFCDILMSAGADPLIMDKDGKKPLHEAALRSHSDPATAMLTCFADCHPSTFAEFDLTGQTILHQAVENLADHGVAMILKLGGSPHVRTSLKRNALHLCTQWCVRGSVQLLSSEGHKFKRIADILLDAGVDVFEKDSEGFNPMEYAARSGNEPLLCKFAEHVRRSLTIAPHPEASTAYPRTLASVWSLAVSHEQWLVLQSISTIDPSFKPDISSLREKLVSNKGENDGYLWARDSWLWPALVLGDAMKYIDTEFPEWRVLITKYIRHCAQNTPKAAHDGRPQFTPLALT